MNPKFSWTDVDDIAMALAETFPKIDPNQVRFTDLKKMVLELADFEEKPGHPVNEKILETIQAAWICESQDLKRDEQEEH